MKTRVFGRAVVAATISFAIGAGCSEKSGKGGGGAGAPAGGGPSGATGGISGQSSGQGGTSGPRGGASGSGGQTPGGAAGAGASAGVVGQSGGAAGQGTGGASGATTGGSAGMVGSGDGGTECCTAKSCQPEAVKNCVCTQWQVADCCSGDWTTFCQTTAEQKCQAKHCLPDPPPAPDGGGSGEKGACCATHSGGGCAEAEVEKCVCGLLPDCCTNAWDSVCVELVRDKYCEDGVRKCVCETWEQASCCSTLWTSVCAIVAEDKCGAKPSCP